MFPCLKSQYKLYQMWIFDNFSNFCKKMKNLIFWKKLKIFISKSFCKGSAVLPGDNQVDGLPPVLGFVPFFSEKWQTCTKRTETTKGEDLNVKKQPQFFNHNTWVKRVLRTPPRHFSSGRCKFWIFEGFSSGFLRQSFVIFVWVGPK